MLLLLTSGCLSLAADTSFAPPGGTRLATLSSRAWLAPVEINDPRFGGSRDIVVPSLTTNIRRYLSETQQFSSVGILPGAVEDRDLVLRFEFDAFRSDLSLYSLYVPAALLTATLYIWLGGPVWVAEQNVGASLRVEDGSGRVLGEFERSASGSDYISFWDPFPTGQAIRTEVLRGIVEEMNGALRADPR